MRTRTHLDAVNGSKIFQRRSLVDVDTRAVEDVRQILEAMSEAVGDSMSLDSGESAIEDLQKQY